MQATKVAWCGSSTCGGERLGDLAVDQQREAGEHAGLEDEQALRAPGLDVAAGGGVQNVAPSKRVTVSAGAPVAESTDRRGAGRQLDIVS